MRAAALACFAETGFAGTSMEAVARRAAVSKPTLYARFPDKHSLFTAVIADALDAQAADEHLDEAPDDDLVTALTNIAIAFRTRANNPAITRLLRVMIAESPQFPELAMRADNFVQSPRVRAAEDLIRRHAAAGVVRDPDIAIDHFIAIFGIRSTFFAAVGMGQRNEQSPAEVRAAVEAFLDGFRTPRRR